MVRTGTCNVLVIGTGAAGQRAAIAADRAGAEVTIIGRRSRLDAHTVLASGGINAALGTRDAEDCWQQHAADTLREGYWLSDPRVVEVVVREAAAVEELAAWGCDFARLDDGRRPRSGSDPWWVSVEKPSRSTSRSIAQANPRSAESRAPGTPPAAAW